jgi:hypothetical protein
MEMCKEYLFIAVLNEGRSAMRTPSAIATNDRPLSTQPRAKRWPVIESPRNNAMSPVINVAR